MGELIKIVNEQESFLRGIQQETGRGGIYEMIEYPQGYLGVRKNITDIVIIGSEIGKEVNNQADIFSKGYTKIRDFFNEKIMGKKKPTIEELLDTQLRNITLLNMNLKHINEEAKAERENLIKYHEEICDELKHNLITVPERQRSLKQRTQEFSNIKQNLTTIKKYDEKYFETEKMFRRIKRSQAEEEHDYVMRMRDTIRLDQEKAFLGVMEELLTKSIHLSQIYSRDTEHIERHVDKTKNVYLRLLKQQGQFLILREGVEKLKNYLINLQQGVMKGINEMNSAVNSIDSLNAVYAPNMGSIKFILDDIRNAHNERAIEMENILERNKLLK